MSGPYETSRQAADAVRAHPRHPPRHRGVDGRLPPAARERVHRGGGRLGAFDHRILLWLAGWEPQTCAVIAGLITRAHAGALTEAQRSTVLDALDVAADYKRDRAASYPDCEASPAELCGTCEHRLATADEYDALAESLRGRP